MPHVISLGPHRKTRRRGDNSHFSDEEGRYSGSHDNDPIAGSRRKRSSSHCSYHFSAQGSFTFRAFSNGIRWVWFLGQGCCWHLAGRIQRCCLTARCSRSNTLLSAHSSFRSTEGRQGNLVTSLGNDAHPPTNHWACITKGSASKGDRTPCINACVKGGQTENTRLHRNQPITWFWLHTRLHRI